VSEFPEFTGECCVRKHCPALMYLLCKDLGISARTVKLIIEICRARGRDPEEVFAAIAWESTAIALDDYAELALASFELLKKQLEAEGAPPEVIEFIDRLKREWKRMVLTGAFSPTNLLSLLMSRGLDYTW